jgi:AraC-like DNA-binding protein
MDRLSALLPRFGFQANTFFTGEFCGSNQFREEGVGHLHLIRRGPVIMEHDDAPSLDVLEPALVFYPRPFRHRLHVPATSRADLVCATVSFKEVHRNPLANALPGVLQIPLAELDDLEPTLRLLCSEASKDDGGKRLVMDHLCDILIVQLLRHALKTGRIKTGVLAGLSDSGIASVLSALHEDPSRLWRVEDMAAIAGMSRSKFAKNFHSIVGVAPAAYLTNWRMDLAENLLNENKSVKAIAVAVGYSSQPAFTRAFIATFGVPPTEWLRASNKVKHSGSDQTPTPKKG